MRRLIEFARPTIIKTMPVVAIVIFSYFCRRIPPEYLWRSLIIHIPIAYFLSCLFFWFAQPHKKHLLVSSGLLALVFSIASFATNLMLYKGINEAFPTLGLSEIEPEILLFNLRCNAMLFIFLFFLSSSYMWIYFYLMNKRDNHKTHREMLNQEY